MIRYWYTDSSWYTDGQIYTELVNYSSWNSSNISGEDITFYLFSQCLRRDDIFVIWPTWTTVVLFHFQHQNVSKCILYIPAFMTDNLCSPFVDDIQEKCLSNSILHSVHLYIPGVVKPCCLLFRIPFLKLGTSQTSLHCLLSWNHGDPSKEELHDSCCSWKAIKGTRSFFTFWCTLKCC